MAPPTPTGSLTINEGTGPFHYGDTLTFTTESSNLRGAHEMIEVSLFQDNGGLDENGNQLPGDGVVTMELMSQDLVFLTLNTPAQATVILGAGSSALDDAKPSKGWARLLSYGWKARQEHIDLLDRVDFDVEL